jgi:hypothetical protein
MKIKKILIACFAILLALLLSSGNGIFRYDNWVRKEDLITVSYSLEEIEWIREQVTLNGGLSGGGLAKRFEIECVRKTEFYQRPYYVIFAIDNGQYAYVIMNSAMKAKECLIWESEFRTKEEFELFFSQNQNYKDLREFNPNYFRWGFGDAVDSFYVQEGMYTIIYALSLPTEYTIDENGNEKPIQNWQPYDVVYLENGVYPKDSWSQTFLTLNLRLYILPIDKQSAR